jgi:cytidyltransferase-like protein
MGLKNKVIYTAGSYDLFHFGHLNILLKAKKLGKHLIVGVSTDALIVKNKGIKPIYAMVIEFL